MSKIPFPGHCLVVVDTNDESDDQFSGGPQRGTVISVNPVDQATKLDDKGSKTYGDLVNTDIYWEQYAESNYTRYDQDMDRTIAFIKLSKIVGYEE